MNKIGLIIKREYLTRVKKKSFILMTLLGPVLFAGFFALIVFLAGSEDKDYKVLVVDETQIMYPEMMMLNKVANFEKDRNNKVSEKDKQIKTTNKLIWSNPNISIDKAIKAFKKEESDYDFLIYMRENIINKSNGKANLIYKKAPNSKTEVKITKLINEARESLLIEKEGIDKAIYKEIKTSVGLTTIASSNVGENGNKKANKAEYKTAAYVGFAFSILILMFILTFGMQVMRGVIEEKTNRIIEVIISSVKPFQIMMGKIVGVGLVGLTQFLFWIILTIALISIMTIFLGVNLSPDTVSSMNASGLAEANANVQNNMIKEIIGLPWLNLVSSFLIYFLGGYLLYSALFAAIGAAVDSETDTQQFMMPIMLPLMLGIYVTQLSVMTNPEGPALFWLSMIPLTSPVVMLVRIAMESVELWEVILSIFILILSFIGTTWLGGKIYKTGILMYGKKVTYKELFKWIKYK